MGKKIWKLKHFVLHQKLTQHCKSAILQLKKLKLKKNCISEENQTGKFNEDKKIHSKFH